MSRDLRCTFQVVICLNRWWSSIVRHCLSTVSRIANYLIPIFGLVMRYRHSWAMSQSEWSGTVEKICNSFSNAPLRRTMMRLVSIHRILCVASIVFFLLCDVPMHYRSCMFCISQIYVYMFCGFNCWCEGFGKHVLRMAPGRTSFWQDNTTGSWVLLGHL